jgi:hypothetical protein
MSQVAQVILSIDCRDLGINRHGNDFLIFAIFMERQGYSGEQTGGFNGMRTIVTDRLLPAFK